MNNEIWKWVVSIVVVILFLGSCVQTEKRDFRKFRDSDDTGKRYLRDGRFKEAIEEFQTAYTVAEKLKWTDGMVSSKVAIADSLSAQKSFQESETSLIEGRSICKAHSDCSNDQLISVNNNLVFLYLYSIHDLPNAVKFINEISQNDRASLGDDGMRNLLDNYRKQMRGAGFPSEAEKVTIDPLP